MFWNFSKWLARRMGKSSRNVRRARKPRWLFVPQIELLEKRELLSGNPVTNPDAYTVAKGQMLSVAASGVLANDQDPNGYPLSAMLIGNVQHGNLSFGPDGSFTYMPFNGFAGTDTFTYQAKDWMSSGNTATVTISVVAPTPTVTGVSPASGPQSGAGTITITGTNFNSVTKVAFGSAAAPSFVVLSPTQIQAQAPSGPTTPVGPVDVVVTTSAGASPTTVADRFTFLSSAPTVTAVSPATGPRSGATNVTITGTNFLSVSQVTFGGVNAASFAVLSPTQISVATPGGPNAPGGPVDVQVTTAYGTSPLVAADQFTYQLSTTTTALSSSAPASVAGQPVTLTAVVSGPSGVGVPGGNVAFEEGSNVLAVVALTAGSAAWTTAAFPVGVHNLTVVYAGTGAFAGSTSPTLTQTVSLATAAMSVTASSTTPTYGQALVLTAGLTAQAPGSGTPSGPVTFVDQTTGATLGTQTLSGGTAALNGVRLTAGTHVIAVSFSGDASFASTSGTITVVVSQAPLTVSAANASRLYGDANPWFTGTLWGVVNGDAISASSTSAATAASHAGTYAITPVLSDPNGLLANYSVTSTPGTLTVSPRSLLVTADNKDVTYGTAPSFTATYSGFVSGDTPAGLGGTLAFGGPAATAVNAGIYAVTPGGLTSGDYVIAYGAGTLTIDPARLTVTAANASRTYGAANPPLTGTVTGVQNGDNITSVFSTAAGTSADPGTYPIVPTLQDPDGRLANYTVTLANGVLTVSPAPLTVTADDQARLYGAANPSFTAGYSGFVLGQGPAVLGGQLAFTTAAGPASDVGSYPITPGGLTSPDYAIAFVNGTFNVTPAPLTVTANDATRAYGDNNPAFTGTLAGIMNQDGITASFVSAAGPATPAGTCPITPVLNDPDGKLADYAVTATSGTLTITPRALLVTADDQQILYGQPLPVWTASYSGFAAGAGPADLGGTLTFTGTAPGARDVGAYTILPGGLSSANYAITFVGGTLTITPAPLTVTADDQAATYGGPPPAFTAHYAGFVNGDSPADLAGTLAFGGTAPGAVNAGTYSILPGGLTSANYTITFAAGTLTIAPAALTVTADDQAITYGQAVPAFTVSYAGFVNGDGPDALAGSPTFTGSAVGAADAGTYTITPGGLSSANYTLTYVSGTLSIAPAPLTVAADDQEIMYGDPLPDFTVQYSGFVNGQGPDRLSGELSFAGSAASATAAGTYVIAPGGLTSADYAITYVNGTLTIDKAPLTVRAEDQEITYGQAPTFAVSFSGLAPDDTAAGLGGAPAFAGPATTAVDAGSYAINVGGYTSPNYDITYEPGTLTIKPAPLTITPDDQEITYGDSLPTFTASYAGLVNGDSPANLSGALTFAGSALGATDAGSYTLTAGGLSSPDYAITYRDGTLTIDPAALTVTADDQTITYGDPLPAFTAAFTGLVNGDTAVTLGALDFGGAAGSAVNAGTYPIAADGLNAPNYDVTYVDGTLTIDPAPLTVTADDQTIGEGDPLPAFTATYTGLVNGDDPSSLEGQPTFAGSASTASAQGTYTITPDGLTSDNYAITYVDGTLTIGPPGSGVAAPAPTTDGVAPVPTSPAPATAAFWPAGALTNPAPGGGDLPIVPDPESPVSPPDPQASTPSGVSDTPGTTGSATATAEAATANPSVLNSPGPADTGTASQADPAPDAQASTAVAGTDVPSISGPSAADLPPGVPQPAASDPGTSQADNSSSAGITSAATQLDPANLDLGASPNDTSTSTPTSLAGDITSTTDTSAGTATTGPSASQQGAGSSDPAAGATDALASTPGSATGTTQVAGGSSTENPFDLFASFISGLNSSADVPTDNWLADGMPADWAGADFSASLAGPVPFVAAHGASAQQPPADPAAAPTDVSGAGDPGTTTDSSDSGSAPVNDPSASATTPDSGLDISNPPSLPADVPADVARDAISISSSSPTGTPTTPPPAGNTDPSSPGSATGSFAASAASSSPAPSASPGGNAGVQPPSPLGAGALVGQMITSGGYSRHYVRSGSGPKRAYEVDVTILSAFGTNAAGAPNESGTITYSAWLKEGGRFDFDSADVVPFAQATASGSSLSFFGLGAPELGVPGFDAADLGIDPTGWKNTHWSDSVDYTARGTFTADNGATYQFVNHYTRDDRFDLTHSWVAAGTAAGAGTETDTSRFSRKTLSDVTASDQPGNLPASFAPGTGAPAGMFAAPGGATYLDRVFSTRQENSNSTVVSVYAGTDDLTSTTTTQHSSSSGTSADRYYFSNTANLTTPGSPNTDTVTWLIDSQNSASFDGSNDSNRNSTTGFPGAGTVKTTARVRGSTLADLYQSTDVYHRENGDTTTDGTYKYRSAAAGPAPYTNEVTHAQTFGPDGKPTADTLSYRFTGAGDRSVSSSDRAAYRTVIGTSPGQRPGHTTGLWYVSSTATSHRDGQTAGTLNELDKTGSIDDRNNSNASGSGLALLTAGFNADDGSATTKVDALAKHSDTSSAKSSAKGSTNADGQQTGGNSSDQSRAGGSDSGYVWSSRVVTGSPKVLSLDVSSAGSSADRTADLSYTADGKASGSVTANLADSSDRNTTSTVHGDLTLPAGLGDDETATRLRALFALPDGSGFANDQDRRSTHADHSLTANLSLSAGLATGTVVATSGQKLTYDRQVYRSVHRPDGLLDAYYRSGANGSGQTTETVRQVYASGTPTTTRTVVFKQDVSGSGDLTADGRLADATGHNGTWKYAQHGDAQAHDRLSVDSSKGQAGWSETGRSFALDDASSASLTFHQQDNGVGKPQPRAGLTQVFHHTVDLRMAAAKHTVQNGTPANFTFSRFGRSSRSTAAHADGATNDPARYQGSGYDNTSSSRDYSFAQWDGTHTGQTETASKIVTFHHDESSLDAQAWNYSGNVENDRFARRSSEMTESRQGTQAAGTGYRRRNGESRAWMEIVDKVNGTGETFGDLKPRTYEPADVDLSWGPTTSQAQGFWATLWEDTWMDFLSDPAVQGVGQAAVSTYNWLTDVGPEVLRVVVGGTMVVSGVASFALTDGLSFVASVGQISVGIDQLGTGFANLSSGRRDPSVFEYVGYSAALGAGLNEPQAQLVGGLTPAVLSAGFSLLATWAEARLVAPATTGAGEYVPNPVLEHLGRGYGQAAEQAFRPWLKAGVNFEGEQLAQLGLPKNTVVWRPTLEQTQSAAFKVIVGGAKYTSGGLLRGSILEATEPGFLEIKGGSSVLNSTYQLRLQTYRSLVEGRPYAILTTRPVNPQFRSWLERWGVTIENP